MFPHVPPFELGETFKGTDDDSNLINPEWLGRIYQLPDQVRNGPRAGKTRRTHSTILAMPLRNTSGAALLGKRIGLLEKSGTSFLSAVNGYAATLNVLGVVGIDEHLPTAGVADDDIFWGILYGPFTVLAPNAGAAFNGDIAAHTPLVAATAAGTTTTLAGRVSNITAAATQGFSLAVGMVGWALTARTTGNTDSEILIKMNTGFRI